MIFHSVFCDDQVTLYTHSPSARIILNNNVILRGARVGCHMQIEIDDNSVIEGYSLFDSDFHNVDATKRESGYEKFNKPIYLCENNYIGFECLIGRGTQTGSDCIFLPATFISGKKIK